MTLHAYKTVAIIRDNVDLDSKQFADSIARNREDTKRRIKATGNDPLPDQQVLLAVDRERREVVVIWRSSELTPESPQLFGQVRAQVGQLTFTKEFRLYYHRCYNGAGRPCPPWQLLMDETI